MREEFHPIKLLRLGYLVYSLGNCAMKLCIETGLMLRSNTGAALSLLPGPLGVNRQGQCHD
jgi:hypothetical protein